MRLLSIFLCLFIAIFSSCLNTKDHIILEKDLIPEGTAFNPKTNSIYIGSIYKQKIVSISGEGLIKDIITKSQFGDLSPLGMEMDKKNDILWVNVAKSPIVKHSNNKEWRTTIMSFDMLTQKLIKKYNLIKGEYIFLNDITLADNGDVYATESMGNKIYKIDKSTDVLMPFIALEGFNFPNGIVFYKKQNCLFVSANEGILKIDIKAKEYSLVKCLDNIDATIIDGLAINHNYFIGHQRTKISKFYFNETITKIHQIETIDSGSEFDSSTTGEIGNGSYHYIVNSQIKSGINRVENKVKSLDSLEHIIIRTKKL